MNKKEGKTLYFGYDDSNHAGPNRKGELVICLKSQNHLDSIVKNYPNTRNYGKFEEWLNEAPENDYRFTILTGEQYRFRPSSSNLIEAIPKLTTPFLTPDVDTIKLYLDGMLHKEERDFLRNYFPKLGNFNIEKVIVNNFIKKTPKNNKRFRKGPNCPRLVYLADVKVSSLFSLDIKSLLSNPKFIPAS